MWRGARSLAQAALLFAVAGCGAARGYPADPGPYDRVPGSWTDRLHEARLRFERGDERGAYEILEPLAEERPKLVPVRIFLQEVELALLEHHGQVGDLVREPERPPQELLFHGYEARAASSPSAEACVLAARLAPEGTEALALLDQADTLDPDCVWVDYGRAWWRYRMRRFKEARESIRLALKTDSGHLPTMRLLSTMQAGAGDGEEAAVVLEIWLDRTADDPLYAAVDRADALLDLAALEVLRGEPKAALEHLEDLDPRAVRDPQRAEEVRAAAHQARGESEEALAAVRRAAELGPRELLPLVQEAMLLERAGDREGERAAWERLLQRLEAPEASAESDGSLAGGSATAPAGGSAEPAPPGPIDFESVLFRMQARTRLERLRRAPP